jgi:hypothetical protein
MNDHLLKAVIAAGGRIDHAKMSAQLIVDEVRRCGCEIELKAGEVDFAKIDDTPWLRIYGISKLPAALVELVTMHKREITEYLVDAKKTRRVEKV